MKNSSNGQCGSSQVTVHAFADNELDTEDRLAFNEHLNACPDCFRAYGRIIAVKALFKRNLPYYRAPDALRIRIALALQASRGATPAGAYCTKSRSGGHSPRPASIRKKWKPINRTASALAVSLVIAVTLTLSLDRPALEEEIIASYKRSLVASLPSNGRFVSRGGNLDFLPPIPNLAGSGFAFEGTRFDQIARHGTAVLIYSSRSYVINLFIWPSEAEPLGALSQQGYNIIHWTRSGLKFCAISTLTARELAEFQQLFASKLPA
jgi:anti-sigma factor (TIGR02949 family)